MKSPRCGYDCDRSTAQRRAKMASKDVCYFGSALREFAGHEFTGTAALDIGCGRWFTDLRILKDRGATTLVGLDVFEHSSIERSMDGVNYLRVDVDEDDLPLSNEAFDVVVLDNVIEHLYRPMHVLDECMRVMKPEGSLIILTPNQARLKNRLKLLIGGSIYYPFEYWAKPSRMWINKKGRMVFAGHIREYTPSEVKAMIESAGFSAPCLRLLKAIEASALDSSLGASRADAIESKFRSKGPLFLYRCAETAFPMCRTMIAAMATKP